MNAFLEPDVWPLIALAILWWALSLSPIFFPVFAALRTRPVLPRRATFVIVVVGLTYGLLLFLCFAVVLPLSAFDAFIAPQLEHSGQLPVAGRWLVAAYRFISTWLWVSIPFVLTVSGFKLTRFLSVRWPQLASDLGPNSSFKSKLLRSST